MKALQLGGRFFYGLVFVTNGIAGHFMQHSMLSQYAGSKGVPMPEVMVIITGVMIILGGLSVMTGYKPKVGLWLLVAFLVPVAFIMHNFWAVPADQVMAERSQFMKDMALAGAAVIMIAFATDEPWPLSVGGGSEGPDIAPPVGSPEAKGAVESPGTGAGPEAGGSGGTGSGSGDGSGNPVA